MRKIVFFVFLFKIFFSHAKAHCEHTNRNRCTEDEKCRWSSRIQCIESVDCSSLSQGMCTALQNTSCAYTPSQKERCIQRQFDCMLNDRAKCMNQSDKCSLKVNKRCTQKPNSRFPNCQSMNRQECLESPAFCQMKGSCQENEFLCEAANRQQCEQKGDKCSFTVFSEAKCEQNQSYCSSKSNSECASASNCKLNFQDFSCQNKQLCQQLDLSDCLKNKQYCTLVEDLPAECVSRGKPCYKIENQIQCEQELNCVYNQKTNSCWFENECHFYNSHQCIKQQETCKYISPKPFACLNKQICEQLNATQCEQKQSLCDYQQSKQTCQAAEKEKCSFLGVDECLNHEYCNVKEEIGDCFPIKDYECSDLNENQCLEASQCFLENFKCLQKSQPICERMSQEECGNYEHCQLEEEFSCVDFQIECPQDKDSCLENVYCEWQSEKPYMCRNLVSCSQFENSCPIKRGECRLINEGCYYLFPLQTSLI